MLGQARIVVLSWDYVEPEVGFEPTTFRLRVGCATTTPLGLGGVAERVGAGGGVYRSGWGWAREGRPGGGLLPPPPRRAGAHAEPDVSGGWRGG
jgi:hypothetical protein